jgi:hypothetical protein
VGSKSSLAAYVRVAASGRAKVHQLALLAERNRKRFIHVHPANWVLDQPTGSTRSIDYRETSRVLLSSKLCLPNEPANNAAQQPHARREHQQPEEKPRDTSKNGHKVFNRGATR